MNEQEYLSKYDRNAYLSPLVTVDAVLFTYHEETLKVLLVERANHPDKGMWGLPGGFIDEEQDSTLEQAILRKLKEKTGVIPPTLNSFVLSVTIFVINEVGLSPSVIQPLSPIRHVSTTLIVSDQQNGSLSATLKTCH